MPDRDDNGRPERPGEQEGDGHVGFDPEAEARRRAALARIRTFGDPALKSKAAEVTVFDQTFADQVGRMGLLMVDALGVGLAATQLGIMQRAFVFRAGSDAPLVAVVNPRLEWASSEQETAEEGCLSLPGVTVDVERSLHVRVGGRDGDGEAILVEASGLEARVVQHELDHLDGVLILDRTTREQRKEALRLLREGPPEGAGPAAKAFEVSPA